MTSTRARSPTCESLLPAKATVQLPASELPAGLAVGDDVIVTPRPVAALAC